MTQALVHKGPCKVYIVLYYFAISLLAFTLCPLYAQNSVEIYMPFDPSNTQSQVPLELNSYYFSGGHRIYAARFGYQYALPNNRHAFGISAPVVHAIFNADYAGYENTTGFGDIHFTYTGAFYNNDEKPLNRMAINFDVTVPTGNFRLGRGVGEWIYQPAIIVTYKPDILWYFFPEVRFQFSTEETNTQPASDTMPDLEDPNKDSKLKNITFSLPTTYSIMEWNGWVGLRADYTYTFAEDTYFLFLRIDVGKMLGERTAASLQLNRFVAGQPRLETFFKVKMNFFLR